MDSTTQFFAKLKKLAKTLESETAKLQDSFENRNNREDDSEAAAKAIQVYHELNSDVGNTKGEIQGHLAQQKARASDVGKFIKACTVIEQKVSKDIQALKQQWDKYGYQAPGTTKLPTKPKVAEVEHEDEDETNSAEEGSREEDEGNDLSSPPKVEPPIVDILKTPQPADFGLSEIDLKRALARAKNCSDVSPMPVVSIPQLSLQTPAPPMALTPKWALRMEDAELQTPQMRDFGISEHTLCLNNDFTMDLFRKNAEISLRPPQDLPVPPVNSLIESLQTKVDTLESPEPPELYTLDLKIKKTNSHCSPPAQSNNDPESPCCPDNLLATPEVPVFQTPFLNRLVSTNKSAPQPEPVNTHANDDDDESQTFELPTPPHNGRNGSKCTWEYNVPDISGLGMEDMEIPEMPKLESVFGKSLQNRNAKNLKIDPGEEMTKDPTVSILELDGPTQEFSLGTPRIRMNYGEFGTPEMPDFTSVTQDICKLVSQAQLKTANTMNTHVKSEKGRRSPPHRAATLSLVSENEFQSLPSYLKQMTVHNINKAVNNINKFIEEHRGEPSELQMEELRKIISVGTTAPVYILCLTELKRLKHIGGVRNTSVYKLITHI
ncbi:SKA complex subunit 3 isoform X2 [Parambassis ranga]|uniref:SKA complex subunit 3 isoform X2 n=1 Tax=Parambassis ranga TaxID=210632 RepID=A0A6P7HDB1_9TELE|nr:spindle and kinetochore-associated protein 3 isoform X2 [Parambassis ranga]